MTRLKRAGVRSEQQGRHAHHQHVAEVGAKEGGVVVGEEAVEQLLGEL